MCIYIEQAGNLAPSDLVISIEPYGAIDPVMMYETSKVALSMRYKDCLCEGIECRTTKGDIKLQFQFADEESWALEVMVALFH